jgi:hypothetical protein
MGIDQYYLVVEFSSVVVGIVVFAAISMKVYGLLSKPRGTYGNGIPERRKRRRVVLPDPATITPRAVPPGTLI